MKSFKEFCESSPKHMYLPKDELIRILGNMIEASLEHNNKDPVLSEAQVYKNRADNLQKWFEYYQDKCKELENDARGSI